ncbi:MAG: 4-hydroxy-3-methylbut-2-enyl diphosphate reductase, partial [Chloroflexi bacterium]|nr:4-hydroxy-3-methylbut-2-enyl diphosphate reductase [Chloroflexota bacterium]
MQIILAKQMGLCGGVQRALRRIEEATAEYGEIAALGAIVHNPQIVERLAQQGIQIVEGLDEVGDRALAVTSHGASPAVLASARDRNLTIIDTTCSLVTKVQRLAKSLVDQDYFVVVFGDEKHPEVKGILGWTAEKAIAVKNMEDLHRRMQERGWTKGGGSTLIRPKKLAVLSQTTQSPDRFACFAREVVAALAEKASEVRLHNTICPSTARHKESARELSQQVDVVLVVGGKASANTRHLTEVCAASGKPAHLADHLQGPGNLFGLSLVRQSRMHADLRVDGQHLRAGRDLR